MAALTPPLGRTLLVAKVDEQLEYGGLSRPLFVNGTRESAYDPGSR